VSKCIIVLGMHRSGTSAFTGVLNILGVELGSNLMEPTKENPRGYFEKRAVMEINDEILNILGSSWDDDFFSPDENWWTNDSLAIFRDKIKKLVENDLMGYEMIGIKDPRICILLPFWLRVISKLNLAPYFVIVLRNPAEVACSLRKRNGFSTEKSLRLWITHILSTEHHTRGLPRAFCSYDKLISDSEKTIRHISKSLGISFPKTYQDTKYRIRQFISPALRHYECQIPENNTPLSELVYECFSLLEEPARTGGELNEQSLSIIDSVQKKLIAAKYSVP